MHQLRETNRATGPHHGGRPARRGNRIRGVLVLMVCLFAPAVARAEPMHPDLRLALERLDAARSHEAYAALRRVWSTWDRADPRRVEEALLAAEGSLRFSPAVRAYAGLLAAHARTRRGDPHAAHRKIRRLGFVDQWLVVGPFDNDGKSGFTTEFEPELAFGEAIVPGRAYSGKERPVRWREIPAAFPYGYLDLGSLLRPEQKVCAYATTFVRSSSGAAPRDISVWVGTTGAFRLFWNGTAVLEDDAYRDHDADRHAARVRLETGPNSLMIKVCGDERPPVVSVRLANSRGAPDDSLKVDGSIETSAAAARVAAGTGRSRARPRGPPFGPLEELERRSRGARAAAADLHAYADYLVQTSGDDPTTHQARNLAQRAAEKEPTIDRLLLAGELAEDRNQRAVWIERAEQLVAPGETNRDVLLARAALARESFNWREAFPLYDQVLALDPDDVFGIRGRVELYNKAGLRRSALAVLEAAVDRNPSSVALLNMYASQLGALGRAAEAYAAEARYAALRFDDRSFLARRIELSLARRDRAAAERWVERLLVIDPDGQWSHGVAARAYRSLGAPERAVAAYDQALALAPEDVGTLRNLADLQGELGRRDEQLALLRRILELRPQDKDVREYVEHIEPESAKRDERYAWDADRFLKRRHAPAAGENRRTLVDLHVRTVFENGLSSEFRQVVFQPLTDSAAALARQYAFQYQADRQRVQLRGARVFRGDGRVDEAIESGEGAANDPSIAMYTSARTFYVQFPRLEPGDVVELRYRVDDVGATNEFSDYFGEIVYLQSNEPVAHAEYVLDTPKSRKIHVDVQRLPGLRRETKTEDGRRIHRFVLEDAPAVTPEPAMPPWPEVLGFVHVSTFPDYEALGRWYWGLSRDQFDLDDQTRALARKITEGATTDLEKVKRIYGWVVTNTRYVALEFGIYGYKPRRCVQTVARGWGDCKDKATVIVTLLKELGIDSTLVILRTGLRGDFRSSVASLAPFDHAIVYVPSLDLYLDGTAEHAGSEELPAMDVGALAVLVNEGNAKLVHLPGPDPERNVRRRETVARLRPDGTAVLDLRFETRGVDAPEWRRRYHAEATRRERVEQDVAKEIPGFRLNPGPGHLVTSDLSDIEEPVRIEVRGQAGAFARREDDRLSVAVTPRLRLTPTYASLSERRLDVRVPPFSTIEDTVVIHLPPGMKVLEAPPSVQRETPFGSFSVQVEQEDGRVVVRSRLGVTVSRVTPDEYAAWKAFCTDADHAFKPRLVIGPT